MKKIYKDTITLNKNSRGCYILDTIKGCPAGALYCGKGCYGACYAKSIATRYGFDFEKLVTRRFYTDNNQIWMFGLSDKDHANRIRAEIETADMPFIRIGEMGDPSVDWEHTLSICREISSVKKKIVIITKHWNTLPDKLLKSVEPLCINTSVSALDSEQELERKLVEYERLKKVCNSVLRIVSCNFNRDHIDGFDKAIIQDGLFKMGNTIDTIFRPRIENYFVKNGIIKTEKVQFLRSKVLASIYNKNTYMGYCKNCPDMCGINYA